MTFVSGYCRGCPLNPNWTTLLWNWWGLPVAIWWPINRWVGIDRQCSIEPIRLFDFYILLMLTLRWNQSDILVLLAYAEAGFDWQHYDWHNHVPVPECGGGDVRDEIVCAVNDRETMNVNLFASNAQLLVNERLLFSMMSVCEKNQINAVETPHGDDDVA